MFVCFRNSANQASAENISAPKDTRPEGSTVKTELVYETVTGSVKFKDAECLLFCLQIKFFVAKWGRSNTLFYRPQPPTKAPIQNINAQPEKTFTEATAENTEQHADAPADTCHNEDKASADADVKNPPAEISAAEGTVRESSESKSTAGVSGESVIKTEPPNTTNLEHAGVNMYGPPALATLGKEASLQGGVETPAVSDATPEEETALQNSTISVTDTLPAPSSQSDADTAKGVEFKVECAPPSEPVFKSGTEEAVEREDEGTVVEQSFDPTPKTAADCDKELNIEDALDQVAASDAEGVLDNTEHAAIRLTDASDVETAKAEAVPKPVEDPRQPHSEDFKPNQKCDDSHM